MMDTASSINHITHLKAFIDVFENQISSVDRSVLMMYLPDFAPKDALPILLRQFGMDGYNGLFFADTEQKQRDLLSVAFDLQSKKGTEFAIKTALGIANSDYLGVVILPSSGLSYDGSVNYDGSEEYGSNSPFDFRVTILLPDNYTVTTEEQQRDEQIILTYKAERSRFVGPINYLSNA